MQPEESQPSLQTDAEEGRPKSSRLFYALWLLPIGLAAATGWVWVRDRGTLTFAPEGTPTIALTAPPLPMPEGDVPGDGFGIVSGPATPWAVAGGPGEMTPAPEATAIPMMTAVPLALLGPPPGSVFGMEDPVSFYWTSPVAAVRGQQFVLYLAAGDRNVPLGAVVAPNLGQGYQLQAVPGAAVGEAGGYSWFVVLANGSNDAIIAQSETRPITILSGN